MRKQILFLFLTLNAFFSLAGQVKGPRIGYIDMEYILQNVSNYKEAQNQLEEKAIKWKQEIETKKNSIQKLVDELKTEKALLTKELIEEREAEIHYLEKEVLEFQQKRFGANGDLMQQKLILTKPVQDQVFTTVQDIAEAKQFDFIFDKSSDLTILFAAKKFDISDQVLRVINRTEKREQLTKKQQKNLEDKENKEDALDENDTLKERQKILDARKEEREKILADRKQLQEAPHPLHRHLPPPHPRPRRRAHLQLHRSRNPGHPAWRGPRHRHAHALRQDLALRHRHRAP